MRKAKIKPQFDMWLNQNPQRDLIVTILVGHLTIEAMLVELLQIKNHGETPWKWPFPKKVERCRDYDFVTDDFMNALIQFNNLRNDYSHILGHEITFNDAFTLIQYFASAKIDFSDDTIHLDKSKSEEWYGTEGVIIEILNNTFFELNTAITTNGGSGHY
ncbi:hypothetical protein KS4_09240 [Poriferisphaera corsica]|uniref:Uncharacterized protein n=1 Tax=Poriferisphaera corsica TaxID=2528020 RepID=A0A517YRM6_9BACT|nr:hypothetical protein [Poriferisphaera corsica]QDU32885.1 hypothetical protein KS4_09240 [Poriferisphaera corsica]